MAVFDVFAWSPLFLTDSVTINIHIVEVEDTVELTDTIRTNQIVQSVENILYLTDEIKINKTVALHTSHSLALTQNGQRTPINVVAADHLIMWQSAITYPKWPNVHQLLVLTDVATCEVGAGTFDILTLTQSVLVHKTVAVHAANTLSVLSKATVFKPDQFWTSYDVVVVNP